MKIIIKPRRTGKTTDLIKLAAENWYYIVCSNPHNVASLARDLELDIPFPLSYGEFLGGAYFGPNMKGIVIDQVDMLLQHIVRGVQVEAVTMTGGPGAIFKSLSGASPETSVTLDRAGTKDYEV